ncbi:site-specific DNA-methyltransferase [Acinetobacter baumannii]
MKEQTNIIFNEDSRNILSVLDKNNINITSTITSPPYFDMKDYGSENQIGFGQTYQQYLEDLNTVFKDIYQITANNGSLWIIIDTFKRDNQVVTLPFDLSNKLKESGWLLQDIIIWKKDKTVPWSNNGFVQRKFEYILYFTKTKNFKYNKDRVRNFDTTQLKKWWVKYPERYNPKGRALDEIWEYPIPVQGSWGDQYIRHFCPLPKEMVATMIEISTDPDDIILDPFAGSGSVLFQSTVMDRKYIGFELNKSYIEMFNKYLESSFDKFRNEYLNQYKAKDQNDFMKQILDLRALKFARILVNTLEKELNFDFKIFVKIQNYLDENNKYLDVKYEVTYDSLNFIEEDILNIIESSIKKPPLSKFGIIPSFTINPSKIYNEEGLYGYIKSNSYAYSNLPISSSKIKVVSDICVNLNENDYA